MFTSPMVYFDNNSTTFPFPEVLAEIDEVSRSLCGNPSSVHWYGQQARRSLNDSRERIARQLKVAPDEVVFTASATEANNLALLGAMMDRPGAESEKTLFFCPVEHSSIHGPASTLASLGYKVVKLPALHDGRIDISASRELMRGAQGIVSVQLCNSETGVIQPVAEITELLNGESLIVHCDAVQGLGKIPIDLTALGVHLASFSAHKVHGPLGIGALFVRRGVELTPVLRGGDQERGIRPGTENAPAAAGFARALEEISRPERSLRNVAPLKSMVRAGLEAIAPDVRFTVDDSIQIANTLHFSIPGIDGQDLVLAADLQGIALSTGSACHQATGAPSATLSAMGLSETEIRGAIRLSLSSMNTHRECEEFLETMNSVFARFPGRRNPPKQTTAG